MLRAPMQEIVYASKAATNFSKQNNADKQKGISVTPICWMGTRNSRLTEEMSGS